MRREKDLIGELDINDKKYYGIHTKRALNNFPISGSVIGDIPNLIYGMVVVKKAAANANMELGALDEKIAKPIIKACDKLLDMLKNNDSFIKKQFPIDIYQGGAGTSTNMNVNEVIANLALESIGKEKGQYEFIHPNDHVNLSQSTNDTYPAAITIGILRSIDTLLETLEKLKNAFEKKAEEFKGIFKLGRTQLQDAVPMTFGQEFNAFATLANEELNNLKENSSFLHEIHLGGTAIGTDLNIPEGYPSLVSKYLSDYTGQNKYLAPDFIEATSDTGVFVSMHSSIRRVAVKLSKICNDLRLLSSGPRAGLNEINLPEVQAGSSIMPGKVNPVIPEVVNQICFKVMGNDSVVMLASAAGQLQLNYAEPVIAGTLFQSIRLLNNGIETLIKNCINGITVNKSVGEKYVKKSLGVITYFEKYLTHDQLDSVALEALKTGKSIRTIILKNKLLDKKSINDVLRYRRSFKK